jgi:hypothetical protein
VHIDITAHNFLLTDALRIHAERRLHFSLSNYDERIQRVVLRLSDINGPRGGADEARFLNTFDVNSERIREVADNAYSRQRITLRIFSFTLTDLDF